MKDLNEKIPRKKHQSTSNTRNGCGPDIKMNDKKKEHVIEILPYAWTPTPYLENRIRHQRKEYHNQMKVYTLLIFIFF